VVEEEHLRRGNTRSYLTECVYHLVLESQISQKIVNLLFAINNQNIVFMALWFCGRFDSLKLIHKNI